MKADSTSPHPWRANPTPRHTTNDASQPSVAIVMGRPRMAGKSISKPARKKSADRPKLASVRMTGPAAAHPSTCGPTRIPRLISRTTRGRRMRGIHSHSNGATAAIVKMNSREFNSL
jgi:hypothetical protein